MPAMEMTGIEATRRPWRTIASSARLAQGPRELQEWSIEDVQGVALRSA